MPKPSPGAMMRGTILSVEPGQNRVYGSWENQQVMGIHPCTVEAVEAPNGDERFEDALGQRGAFRRGGLAIHVSGKDDFGSPTGPGWIRAMAMHQIHWPPHARNIPSGLGCREPEPAVIVTSASRLDWQHHAHYDRTLYLWTLEGIWRATRDLREFTPRDLCDHHNIKFQCRSYTKYDKTQEVSARRLLEGALAVSNHGIAGQPVLEHAGRWAYRWRGGAR